jgi:hypothetical protein
MSDRDRPGGVKTSALVRSATRLSDRWPDPYDFSCDRHSRCEAAGNDATSRDNMNTVRLATARGGPALIVRSIWYAGTHAIVLARQQRRPGRPLPVGGLPMAPSARSGPISSGLRREGVSATACKLRFSAIRPQRHPERPARNRPRRSKSSNWASHGERQWSPITSGVTCVAATLAAA